MKKNTAGQKWIVFAFNRKNNIPQTGDSANITAKISKDYGVPAITNDANPTEIEDGYYAFDLTQAETNADSISIFPESSTTDVQVLGSPSSLATIDTSSLATQVAQQLSTLAANPLAVNSTTSEAPPIDVYRSTDWSFSVYNLPARSTWIRFWLSVKRHESCTDDEALLRVQVSKAGEDQSQDGLQRINGDVPDVDQIATLTVSQATPTLSVRCTVNKAASARIPSGEHVFDLRVLDADGESIVITPDTFEVKNPITLRLD